uniref:NACHT domain-containing protein n=1 Tax=Candidatus Kentrum sp. LFY TaxID=2126342 RepID=A0A450UJM0_9GAMM|nr:MAG: NACHT domain-containing protein [Candidatus Kentron sp. LFY]
MRTIDISTLHSLVDIVSPLVRTEPERRALVEVALEGNRELSKKIQWTGTGELFLLKFFQLLMEDANERDSTNTITAFLHAARDRLGSEHHRRINEAVRSVEDSLTFEREPSDPGPPLPLKIFLASPGDVSHERQLAREVIGYIPYDPLLRERIDLKEIAWDTPGAQTPLFAATSPQTSVIRNLSPPSECDLVVVILWSRIGTPLNRHYHRTDNGGRYNSGTEWEYLDALNANRKQGTPDILVYRRTENPRIDVNDPKVHDAISQWQSVEEFFSGFNDADGSALGGYNSYKTPDEFRRQFESHLKAFIRQRLDARTQRPSVSVEAGGSPLEYWEGSPFPGLRAFTPDDAPIFFGRGRETDELLERLSHKQNRFIAVVGASGSGKSSLVAAGLIPRLLAGAMEGRMDWRWIRFTPGAQPFVAFANAIAPSSRQGTSSRHGLPGPSARDGNKQPGSREPASRDGFDEPSARDGKGMDDYDPGLAEALSLLESALHGSPDSTEWLIYIDQFEEFLTLTRPSLQGEFVEWLARLTTMPRVHVIVTLRADFYAGCVAWESLSKLLRTGSFPLSAPNMVALHEMITRPADRARLHFESGLPVQILEDTGADPGSLALMAFALAELHAGRGDGGELTFDAYHRFDGVRGVIGKRAEETLAKLDPVVQDALSHAFRELVKVDDRGVVTRQRAPKPRVVLSPESDVLVTALTDARLLVSNVDGAGVPIIEVAHEALLRSWPRLAGWIESCKEDLRQLRQVRIAVEEWVRFGKAKVFLWHEERRLRSLNHLQAAMLHLSEDELEFLGMSLGAGMINLQDRLEQLSEKELQSRVIEPLLKEMGFEFVRDVSGQNEKGKNLVAIKSDLGAPNLYAIQIKKQKYYGEMADPSSLADFLGQLEQATNEPVFDATSKRMRAPDRLVFITPYKIDRSVLDVLKSRSNEVFRRQVEVVDGAVLVDKITNLLPDVAEKLDRKAGYKANIESKMDIINESSSAFGLPDPLRRSNIYVEAEFDCLSLYKKFVSQLLLGYKGDKPDSLERRRIALKREDVYAIKELLGLFQGSPPYIQDGNTRKIKQTNTNIFLCRRGREAENLIDSISPSEKKKYKIFSLKARYSLLLSNPTEFEISLDIFVCAIINATTDVIGSIKDLNHPYTDQSRLDRVYMNLTNYQEIMSVIVRWGKISGNYRMLSREIFEQAVNLGKSIEEDKNYASTATLHRLKYSLFLTGLPGAGKTTLLKTLADRISKELEGVKPAFIRAADITNPTENGIIQHAYQEAKSLGMEETPKSFLNLFNDGKIILLIDGLDEAGNKIRPIQNAIISLGKKPGSIIIVSSRENVVFTAWVNAIHIRLMSFDDVRLNQFIDNYFSAQPSAAMELRDWLENSPDMKKSAKVPIIAALLCSLFEVGADLPTKEIELYERRLQLLLGEWEKAKGIPAMPQHIRRRYVYFLMNLANKVHEEKVREFSFDTAVKVASKFIVPGYHLGTESMVRDCINRSILFNENNGVISFGHLTYQEYLVAQYAMQYNAVRKLKEKIGDKWWDNVMLLYSSIIGDISSLLELISIKEQESNKALLYKMLTNAQLTDIDRYPILREVSKKYRPKSLGTGVELWKPVRNPILEFYRK